MSGIVRDLKAAGQDMPEEEQALNVIRATPVLIPGGTSCLLWRITQQKDF